MASTNLQNALMRPAILQILRAAGFHNSSGAALDVMTDLGIRYLLLLAASATTNAFNNHNGNVPTIQDVRMSLMEVGALRPQMSPLEEKAKGPVIVDGEKVPFEDMRGINDFTKWARGPVNLEIRRIVGLSFGGGGGGGGGAGSGAGDAVEVGVVLDENEDYVTALKKKHTRAGEDSRYQGTILGKEVDEQKPITIVGGGPLATIQDWADQLNSRVLSPQQQQQLVTTPDSSIISSAPLTPVDDVILGDE